MEGIHSGCLRFKRGDDQYIHKAEASTGIKNISSHILECTNSNPRRALILRMSFDLLESATAIDCKNPPEVCTMTTIDSPLKSNP